MHKLLSYDISDFLEEIDDAIGDYIDKVELEPIKLGNNMYLTGFRRTAFVYTNIEAHIKEIRTVKLNTLSAALTDEDGFYMMEPDGEVWMHVDMFSDRLIRNAFEQFKTNFEKLTSLHVMNVRYKEKGSKATHIETLVFKNKRVACKQGLLFKRKYDEVTIRFTEYVKVNDEWIEKDSSVEQPKHEPSDLEVAMAAAE